MKFVIALSVLATALFSTVSFASDLLPNAGGAQKVHARDGRQIIGDAKGLSVYTFAPDKADVSVCYNGCAKEWPPVLVSAKAVVKAPFGVTKRKDAKLQLTYKHRPLYNYNDDKITGDMFGEGKGGIWFVVEIK